MLKGQAGRIACAAALLLLPIASLGGAIVAGKACPVASLPDADTARLLFLGEVPTLNGQPVIVVFQQPDTARQDFEEKVMGQTGAQLTAQMSRLIFTGGSRPPVLVYDDSNVKMKVNTVRCAVGFISDRAIDDSVNILLRY